LISGKQFQSDDAFSTFLMLENTSFIENLPLLLADRLTNQQNFYCRLIAAKLKYRATNNPLLMNTIGACSR
jgi:hypothetical protein